MPDPKPILADELHVTVRIPADLPDAELKDVRRVLGSAAFLAALAKAVEAAVRSFPELDSVQASVAR